MPGIPQSNANKSILSALMLAQAKNEGVKAKNDFKKLSEEHKAFQMQSKTALDGEKKKRLDQQKKTDRLTKEHQAAKKELHHYKMQYDGNYSFSKKEESKAAMKRAREGRAKKQLTERTKRKEAKS